MGNQSSSGFVGELNNIIISLLNHEVVYRSELCQLMRSYYEDKNNYTEEEAIQYTAEKLIKDLLDPNKYGNQFIPAVSKANSNAKYNLDRIAINSCLARSALNLLQELKTDLAMHAKMLDLAARGSLDKLMKIEKFTDIDWVNAEGESVIILACKFGHAEIANYALKQRNADINLTTIDGNNALIYAAKSGLLDIIKLLTLKNSTAVHSVNKQGFTALMYAAEQGHFSIVQHLLDLQANPNIVNKAGDNALLLAVNHGFISIVKALVVAGSALDQLGSQGCSALILAAKHHSFDTIEYLIGCGASIDILDNEQNSLCKWENNRGSLAQAIQRGFNYKIKRILQQNAEFSPIIHQNQGTQGKNRGKFTGNHKASRGRAGNRGKFASNSAEHRPLGSFTPESRQSLSFRASSSSEDSETSSNSSVSSEHQAETSAKQREKAEVKQESRGIAPETAGNHMKLSQNVTPLGSDDELSLLEQTESAMKQKITGKLGLNGANKEEMSSDSEQSEETPENDENHRFPEDQGEIVTNSVDSARIIAGEDSEGEEIEPNNVIINAAFTPSLWISPSAANRSEVNEIPAKSAKKHLDLAEKSSDSEETEQIRRKESTNHDEISGKEEKTSTFPGSDSAPQLTALSFMKNAVKSAPINPFAVVSTVQNTPPSQSEQRISEISRDSATISSNLSSSASPQLSALSPQPNSSISPEFEAKARPEISSRMLDHDLQKKLESFEVLAWLDSEGFDAKSIGALQNFNFGDIFQLEIEDAKDLLGDIMGEKLYKAAKKLRTLRKNETTKNPRDFRGEEAPKPVVLQQAQPVRRVSRGFNGISAGNHAPRPIKQGRRPVQAVWSSNDSARSSGIPGHAPGNTSAEQNQLIIATELNNSEGNIVHSAGGPENAGKLAESNAVEAMEEPKSAPLHSFSPASTASTSAVEVSAGKSQLFSPSNWKWPTEQLKALKQATSEAVNSIIEANHSVLNAKRKHRKKRLTARQRGNSSGNDRHNNNNGKNDNSDSKNKNNDGSGGNKQGSSSTPLSPQFIDPSSELP
jgi:hypothetical protein